MYNNGLLIYNIWLTFFATICRSSSIETQSRNKMNDCQQYNTNRSHRISSKKSASIPLPKSHIRRTLSEIQLEHDEKMAEWREGQMYHRLLLGMIRRSGEAGYHPKMCMSIKNFIQINTSPVIDVDNRATRTLTNVENERPLHELDKTQDDEEIVSSTVNRQGFLALEAKERLWARSSAFGCNFTQSCPTLQSRMANEDGESCCNDIMFDFDM